MIQLNSLDFYKQLCYNPTMPDFDPWTIQLRRLTFRYGAKGCVLRLLHWDGRAEPICTLEDATELVDVAMGAQEDEEQGGST